MRIVSPLDRTELSVLQFLQLAGHTLPVCEIIISQDYYIKTNEGIQFRSNFTNVLTDVLDA